MSRLQTSDLERVAEQAYLNLTEEEKGRFLAQLNAILDAAAKIDEVPTDGVSPMTHAVSLRNVMRPDENRPSLPQERVLENAPQAQNGFFRVPKILD